MEVFMLSLRNGWTLNLQNEESAKKMRFSSLCGSRCMAEWHILAKVFWTLQFFMWLWLCLCSVYLVLSILKWVCFWAVFNSDTVSVDANPVMSMFATTGSKEINLETELFSLVPCWYAHSSFCGWHVSYVVGDFVVVIIDLFQGLGP